VISQPHSPFSFGVIGYPLGHSLSPRLHAAALRASGLEGEYRLYPILPHPAGQADLEAIIGSVRASRLDGLNVTIPHKQAVIPYLDELTSLAAQIGAVNTIYRRGAFLVGDNTDAPGFMADLHRQFKLIQAGAPGSALVLGSGGAARAVVHALLSADWQVVMAARHSERAQEIKDQFSFIPQPCIVIQFGSLPEFISGLEDRDPTDLTSQTLNHGPLSLIVNTTPVGMAPKIDFSPWPVDLRFPDGAFIYDLVYNPVDTALVRAARAAGLAAASGLGMLIEQAALSFERWTGMRPSTEAMRQAALNNPVQHDRP
jgi:shikimate dehydrogenase